MSRHTPFRVTYDPDEDAAYIYLTGHELSPGRVSVPVWDDEEGHPDVVLDFKDGRLVGIEILRARDGLPADLLGLSEF